MGFLKAVRTMVDMVFNAKEYKDVGSVGERYTFNELKSMYKQNQILRNVYLKKENGDYTEIDLLLVTLKGIFVLESKNYSGWIFGDENQANWMQTLERGNKYKFYNPIWQNNTHIKSIKKALKDYPNIKYYSVIVFSERCALKSITCTSENTYVIKRDGLQDLLKSISKLNNDSLNDEDLSNVINLLSRSSRPKQEIKEQHLRDLNESFKKCPRCKSELVERENKKTGEKFYGCASFPKCRYVVNEIKQVND